MNTPNRSTDSAKRLSRRHFIQASAAVGSSLMMLPRSQAAGNSLEGYASATSVAPGGSLNFFLRDPQAVGAGVTAYPVTFTRVGAPDVFMFSTSVNVGNQVVPADVVSNGCRWARSYQLVVPASWPSGLYYAYIGSGANACTVPFVVRAVSSTPGVRALLQIQVSTIQAYNPYGGKSLYDYNSSAGVRSSTVSFDRPFTEAFNSFFDVYGLYLVRWLAKNNLTVDFCTDIDIVANPAILDPYQLFIDVGHDEYWTLGRRQTMDAFVARGGNAAYFGANTSWFQSRLEAGNGVANRTLVCYKDAAADPVTDPALKTVNFVSLVPPNPENQTTGLGFLSGCSWASALPRPDTPWAVQRADHWVFAGTGLAANASFGGQYVGYECDAARFTRGAVDARAYPTGVDGSPSTLRILAVADGSNWNDLSLAAGGPGEQSGHSMISVYSRGGGAGTVFNAGSVEWAYGLIPELNGQTATPISRITLNVVNKLLTPWAETADVRQFRNSIGGLPNYYETTGTSARAGSGGVLDGLAFRAFTAPVAGSVPVYRLRGGSVTDPALQVCYLTLNPVPSAGLVSEGVAFHVYPSARNDAAAIYGHNQYNAVLQLSTTVYTASPVPPAGFNAGPIRFYAPTDGVSTTTPPPAASFTVALSATSLTVQKGQSARSTVTVNAINGFVGTVAFSASGAPSGVVASFAPASSASGSVLTLSVSANAAAGTHVLTVNGSAPATATSVAINATATLTLVITAPAPAPQSFELGVDDTSVVMLLGGVFGDSVRVSVAARNGFAGTVAFSASGLPSGMNYSFSPASSRSASVLSFRAANWLFGAQRGSFTVTVKGVSGSLVDTTTFRLTVL